MSSQTPDEVFYRGTQFNIVNARGRGLFCPQQHGMRPDEYRLTVCMSGFIATYELTDGQLYLKEVSLYLRAKDAAKADRGEGPLLFGKVPRRYPQTIQRWVKKARNWVAVEVIEPSTDFVVDGLREPIRFKGRLTLGTDFIRDMYEHGAPFQEAYKYQTVFDVVLKAGKIVAEYDRSEEMAAYRERLTDDKSTNGIWKVRTREWIHTCFPWYSGPLW